jgi:hypothetical protein
MLGVAVEQNRLDDLQVSETNITQGAVRKRLALNAIYRHTTAFATKHANLQKLCMEDGPACKLQLPAATFSQSYSRL